LSQRVIDCITGVLELQPGDFELDTPFMELGVDSILAVDIVARIREVLGINIRTTDLFQYTTTRDLCRYLATFAPEGAAAAAESLNEVARNEAAGAPGSIQPSIAPGLLQEAGDGDLLQLLKRLTNGELTASEVEQLIG
jgi:acyl carrier protein